MPPWQNPKYSLVLPLPSQCQPVVGVYLLLMVPAFLLTEGTMTLVGVGFPEPAASWGAMLRDAWQGGALTDAPWLLTPAVAIVLTMLALHLMTGRAAEEGPRAGTFS